MYKIQRISHFQHSFSFSSPVEQFDSFYQRFLLGDLGKIYLAIPWEELVYSFGLKDSKMGPTSIFSPQGKLALMFLKHYGCCSDKRLIQQLNGNLEWQFFCGIYLGSERLENFKIVSEVRCELSKKLNADQVQQILYDHWSPHMTDKHSLTTDATCYESHLRYPTNAKLLWECVDCLYGKLKMIAGKRGEPMPRTKYLKWKKRYVSYSKMRRKTRKKRKAITRSLLLLLNNLNGEMDRLEEGIADQLTPHHHKRRATAKKVFQQWAWCGL